MPSFKVGPYEGTGKLKKEFFVIEGYRVKEKRWDKILTKWIFTFGGIWLALMAMGFIIGV